MASRQKKKAEPTVFAFKMDGKVYSIDADSLTWGETEEAEVYFDCAYEAIDFETARGVMFLGYIARKRVEPDFTLDDMRAARVTDFEEVTDTRPTSAGDAAPEDAASGDPS